MNDASLKALKSGHPDAFAVWEDRMFEVSQRYLIDTLLLYAPESVLAGVLKTIEKEIEHERNREASEQG